MNLFWGGAAAYGLTIAGLYLLQESLLFPREAARVPAYPLPAGTETLSLDTAEGHRLTGYLVAARQPSRGLLLGFPGNAWNAADCAAVLSWKVEDFDIAVFHYRGYAPSEGVPGERALFNDALLIHDTLQERLRPQKVLAVGFSLGSGVAAYLARARSLDGIALVTPFDSIQAMARQRYFWAPVGAILKHPFRSDRHLAGLDIPAAVLMAGRDRIVPRVSSQRLIDVLVRPVLVETIAEATHVSIYDHQGFDSFLARAIDLVAGAPAASLVPLDAAIEDGPGDLQPLPSGL